MQIISYLDSKKLTSVKLTNPLVIACSLLLGIWAIKNTIALRNILLWTVFILSVLYLILKWREKSFSGLFNYGRIFPLFLLVVLFFWIICHYLFFSIYPEEQFKELKSTWLRSLLAATIAFATAVAITKKKQLINIVWIGMLISYFIFFCQYFIKTTFPNNILTSEINSYLFILKVNAVLVGIFLNAGLSGSLFIFNSPLSKIESTYQIYIWAASTVMVTYLFVFAVGSRIGFALSLSILFFTLFFYLIKHYKIFFSKFILIKNHLRKILVFFFTAILMFWIASKHLNATKVWDTFFEDVSIGVQVEKYEHWRDPKSLGYPVAINGRKVIATTYERSAWPAAAVLIFIPENMLGNGVLSNSFPRFIEAKYGENTTYIPSTHSAWIDFTLSYGLIGTFLFLSILIYLICVAIRRRSEIDGVIFILSASILLLYAVAEVGVQHGIEMLVFFTAFLSGLHMFNNSK